MSAYINRKQTDNVSGVGGKPWIPANRWGFGADFSILVEITGTATVDVEGTLDQINRGDIPKVFKIQNATGLTTTTALNITDTPLEAIRVNQLSGTGTVAFHVMQGGS